MGITFQPVAALQTNMRILEGDYKGAKKFGNIRVGSRFLFYQNEVDVRFVPVQDIAWGYLSHGAGFECNLVVVTQKGNAKRFSGAKAVHAQQALQYLRSQNPAILVGYAEEQAGVLCGNQ